MGSTVGASPRTVRIWFDGALEPLFSNLQVQDSRGKRLDKGDGHVDAADPKLLEATLPALEPGNYRVFWNVVTRDGHRTTGDYWFTVK